MAAKTKDPRDSFFPRYRRKVKLENWIPKMNGEEEKRVRFNFSMPITGEEFNGFPDFLKAGFEAVEKADSGGVFTSDTILEGMALEYFDVPTAKEKVQRAIGVTLQGFELHREKEGDSYVTVLRFNYTVPWFKGFWRFIDTYWRKTLYVECEASGDWKPEQDPVEQMKLAEA